MTLTLDLTPEEHAALQSRARAEGVSVEAVLRGLIAGLTPPPTQPPSPFAWAEDDDDPETQAERDRERAEIAANVQRWRAEREDG